jgi:hypothetical protein
MYRNLYQVEKKCDRLFVSRGVKIEINKKEFSKGRCLLRFNEQHIVRCPETGKMKKECVNRKCFNMRNKVAYINISILLFNFSYGSQHLFRQLSLQATTLYKKGKLLYSVDLEKTSKVSNIIR